MIKNNTLENAGKESIDVILLWDKFNNLSYFNC